MRFALINPRWQFEGSIYFGCHDPHLPLEFGYAAALLAARGHKARLFDQTLESIDDETLEQSLRAWQPDFIVVTTAPSYLFWRCPPPELRVPAHVLERLSDISATRVVVGPHASTTPEAVLKKTGAHVAVLGECEEVLAQLADEPWPQIAGIAYRDGDRYVVQGSPRAADMQQLPALVWPDALIARHTHHHHRFDGGNRGLGAEVEASRGCPYACTFCAKENFRDKFRWRPLPTLLKELDGLIVQGVGYVYFIDEIFLPNVALLEALAERPIQFGVQTRIDLWPPEMLDRLGAAGCVSIEAGVESISEAGRILINKRCKLTAAELQERLIHARQSVPFVQASLIDTGTESEADVEAWRQALIERGVWANKPVPMFPYPGSPSYSAIWGPPDEHAWERAVDHYIEYYQRFSDIQDQAPLPLAQLESWG